MTKLHMLQLGNADGSDSVVYCDTFPGCLPLKEGIERIKAADKVVFHGGINFDWWVLDKFHPGVLPREKMLDTVIMARLAFPAERNHTLKAWGERTGTIKGKYKGDWQTVDQEMVDYALQDVHAGRATWNKVKHVLSWGEACQLEHDVAWAINAMERNGFKLDVAKAQELEAELRGILAACDAEIVAMFPPIERTRTFIPKVNSKKFGYQRGVPFTKRWTEHLNVGSRAQLGARLVAAGWAPKHYGADGRPTLNEKTLATIKHPAAAILRRRFAIEKQLGQISDGDVGWLKVVKPDGRVYGRVNTNGAVTGRMSHSRPNMAQVSKKDMRMREVWVPRDGWKLVGCDAAAIEARLLGHYLFRYDQGAFIKMVMEGKSSEGTDFHSANMKAIHKLGWKIKRDPGAKRLFYALLYGAGDVKLGVIINEDLQSQGLPRVKLPPRETGALARKALATSMKGLDKLSADITKAIKTRGFLRGLDGRHCPIRSPHSALNSLLQGAGAIVMKKALQIFDTAPHGEFGYCANVHDEVQLETAPENAEWLGRAFADAIVTAGELLNVKCPLAGEFSVGNNWAETH
jgi:DNA polymerase-1